MSLNLSVAYWPEWTTEMFYVQQTSELVGWTATSFYRNTSMADTVFMLAGFYAQNPNLGPNSSTEDRAAALHSIALLLGSTTDKVQLFWDQTAGHEDPTGIWGNMDLIGGAVAVISEYRTNNYTASNTGQRSIEPVFIILSLIAAGFLMVRFYSKLHFRVLAADWVMLLAYVSTFLMGLAITLLQNYIGAAWDWDETYHQHVMILVWLDIIFVCYTIPILLIKTSWLLFYYDLFKDWKLVRWAIIVTFVVTVLNTIAYFATQLWGIYPIDYWNNPMMATAPIRSDIAGVATGALNILTDIFIWVLPLPLVWRLSISTQERLISLISFGFGAIACVAGTVRIVYFQESVLSTSPESDKAYIIRLFTIIEMYLGIIGGCIPAVRALIKRRSARKAEHLEMQARPAYDKHTNGKSHIKNQNQSQSTRRLYSASFTRGFVHTRPENELQSNEQTCTSSTDHIDTFKGSVLRTPQDRCEV